MKPNESKSNGNKMKPEHNATQYITLQYTKQFKNTIIQIEKNEMKLNVNKANQMKWNQLHNTIHYTTAYNTIQYNAINTIIQIQKTQKKPKETKQRQNLTKQIQTKSNQHYNTINNNIILNFTRIRNLVTLKTLDVHRTPPCYLKWK